jgi:transposase-like protein
MNTRARTYKRHRFSPAIILYAVWVYFRFNLSHRDIENLLAQLGIELSCPEPWVPARYAIFNRDKGHICRE